MGLGGDGQGVDRIVHRIRGKLLVNTVPRTAKHIPMEETVLDMFRQFSPRYDAMRICERQARTAYSARRAGASISAGSASFSSVVLSSSGLYSTPSARA